MGEMSCEMEVNQHAQVLQRSTTEDYLLYEDMCISRVEKLQIQ